MNHLPLRTYYAFTGRRDLAGRLPETQHARLEAAALQYPDARYWQDQTQHAREAAQRLAQARLAPEAVEQLAAGILAVPDEWMEAHTWLQLCCCWRRVERLLADSARLPSIDELVRAFVSVPA